MTETESFSEGAGSPRLPSASFARVDSLTTLAHPGDEKTRAETFLDAVPAALEVGPIVWPRRSGKGAALEIWQALRIYGYTRAEVEARRPRPPLAAFYRPGREA